MVRYTENKSFQGLYLFRFKTYYDESPDNFFEIDEPFKVGIINPCESPRSLKLPDLLLNDLVLNYTLMTSSIEFTFPEFIPDPIWCEVQYTYQVNSIKGFFVV